MQKSPLVSKKSIADLMGFAGLIFFGRCARKLLEVHQVRSAFVVLGILAVWMFCCLVKLRNQNRV